MSRREVTMAWLVAVMAIAVVIAIAVAATHRSSPSQSSPSCYWTVAPIANPASPSGVGAIPVRRCN